MGNYFSEKFMDEMENYFFVGHVHFELDSQEFGFSGLIFISTVTILIRGNDCFSNLIDIFCPILVQFT
ncbi:MAG: hypothetical protein ACFFD7_03040 [Candidatus Thorarchaeota archaeon]